MIWILIKIIAAFYFLLLVSVFARSSDSVLYSRVKADIATAASIEELSSLCLESDIELTFYAGGRICWADVRRNEEVLRNRELGFVLADRIDFIASKAAPKNLGEVVAALDLVDALLQFDEGGNLIFVHRLYDWCGRGLLRLIVQGEVTCDAASVLVSDESRIEKFEMARVSFLDTYFNTKYFSDGVREGHNVSLLWKRLNFVANLPSPAFRERHDIREDFPGFESLPVSEELIVYVERLREKEREVDERRDSASRDHLRQILEEEREVSWIMARSLANIPEQCEILCAYLWKMGSFPDVKTMALESASPDPIRERFFKEWVDGGFSPADGRVPHSAAVLYWGLVKGL